jgi:hypothetical protein
MHAKSRLFRQVAIAGTCASALLCQASACDTLSKILEQLLLRRISGRIKTKQQRLHNVQCALNVASAQITESLYRYYC